MSSGKVLTVENLESLLERLNLFLASCNAVLVADTGINTRWLQLVKVCQSCIKLLLCAFQIRSLGDQSLFLILLLGRLVFNVSALLCLVDLRIRHELIVFLLRSCFRCLGVCLKAGKIRLDHFEHANNTAALTTHSLVW